MAKAINEKIFQGFPLEESLVLQILPTTLSLLPLVTPASVGNRARSQEVNL
jgi:hypothetical protein